MGHRVVITGIGIYSCLGKNLGEVTQSLYAGKSGIVFDQVRKDFGFRSALTGMVEEPDLKNYLSRRQRVGMHQPAVYAYMATHEALALSGLDVDFLDPAIAPAVGTTVPGGATFREAHLAMELLHESGLVSSLDIVELNPTLDENGRTAALMVDLAASLMGRRIMGRATRAA